jgi:uncharacterized protein (TIGR00251 family)
MEITSQFFQEFQDQGSVAVRITPNAKKNEIVEKMKNGSWKIRIAAPAVEEKANKKLLQFLKKEGGIRAEIIAGEKNREKVLRIQ